ncbi:MAG: apolipoprotein N-acyltransferase [Cellvibrionaceae bacterium]|nr:apolipoprotein N-acyltransferase [Cellvibrionaceae bacterium]
MRLTGKVPFWLRLLLAPLAGMLVPLSLAPYEWWALGLLSVGFLAAITYRESARHSLLLGLAFGLGMYGLGASWVYVSINQFGSTSVPLALLLTSLFVAGLSLCFSLPFYVYGRWFNKTTWSLLLGFPAIWVLNEWARSWFLTGFPWLYLGYAHLHTPLGGWAPVLGVFGVGFIAAYSSCVLLAMRLRDLPMRALWGSLALALLLWAGGAALRSVDWTTFDDKPIAVGMAQANIPQERKWDPMFLNETFRIFNDLSAPLWDLDWVIWPEAAIPLLYHEALADLESLGHQADKTNTVFITGILYDDRDKQQYYNSIVAVGKGSGITFKTRLVPFGEYVPMERWLRGLIDFFNLPTSIIHPGPKYVNGLQANGVEIAPSICYEVVYPDLVASRAANANVLLTVSNDSWFGSSIGPLQHFEMAQMRALETGRYLVRATNNGVSGIIDPKGRVVVKGGRFTREAIVGQVFAASGITPFIFWGSTPVVLLAFVMLGILAVRLRSSRRSVLTEPQATI